MRHNLNAVHGYSRKPVRGRSRRRGNRESCRRDGGLHIVPVRIDRLRKCPAEVRVRHIRYKRRNPQKLATDEARADQPCFPLQAQRTGNARIPRGQPVDTVLQAKSHEDSMAGRRSDG
jgi:hypothetical protein